MKEEPRVIAWDLDKSLTNETSWTKEDCLKATPNLKNIAELKRDDEKNFVVIYTARRKELAVETIEWLEKNNLGKFPIKFEKLPADVYKDDKAHKVK
jgi:hypothetical protein